MAVATHFKFFFFVIYMSGTHGNARITETPEKHFLASLALSFSPSGRLKLTQHYSSVNTFSLTICLSHSLTRRHTHTQKKSPLSPLLLFFPALTAGPLTGLRCFK